MTFSGEFMQIAGVARWTSRAAAIAGCVALAGLATPAFAQDPPGNNGTVKVDGVAFDDDPANEPHPDDCTFQIDFYGFDKGNLFADVTFETQSPTPTGPDQVILETDRVFIGGDDNSGGGSQAGLDASATYTLDFGDIEPQPNQGFHVKLTIDAEGSQGADSKFKVFWVPPCPTPTPTPTPTPSKSHTPSPTPTPTPSKSHTPSPTPTHTTPAPVPTAVPGGADAAGGGAGAGLFGGLVLAGGAVAGTAAIARRRFLHDS